MPEAAASRRGKLWAVGVGLAGAGFGVGTGAVSDGFYVAAAVLFLLGSAGLGIFVFHEVRILRASRRHWSQWQSRVPQSDETFLMECGIPPGSSDGKLALHVRTSLGVTAGLPPETVYACDSMSDSIWDSIDLLDIWFRVEKAAGVKVMKEWLDLAFTRAGDHSRVLVRHLVTAIVENTRPARGRTRTEISHGEDRNSG